MWHLGEKASESLVWFIDGGGKDTDAPGRFKPPWLLDPTEQDTDLERWIYDGIGTITYYRNEKPGKRGGGGGAQAAGGGGGEVVQPKSSGVELVLWSEQDEVGTCLGGLTDRCVPGIRAGPKTAEVLATRPLPVNTPFRDGLVLAGSPRCFLAIRKKEQSESLTTRCSSPHCTRALLGSSRSRPVSLFSVFRVTLLLRGRREKLRLKQQMQLVLKKENKKELNKDESELLEVGLPDTPVQRASPSVWSSRSTVSS